MDINNCVVCSCSNDLNTSMTIPIDGESHTILLCDNCSDDTTPKVAREALQGRLDAINQFYEQAKQLGISIPKNDNGKKMVVVKSDEKFVCECGKECTSKSGLALHKRKCSHHVQQQTKPTTRTESAEPTPNRPKLGRQPSAIPSVSGNVSGVSVEQHGSLPVDDVMKQTISQARNEGASISLADLREDVEVQEAVGRGDQPMVVPKVMKSAAGITKIKIEKREDDRALQERFKRMAEESKQEGWEDTKHNGWQYDNIRDIPCAACRGTGIARIGGGECQKCDGLGIIAT